MEIKTKQENLLSALNGVSKAIPSKTTMSILECVLISVENDEVHLIGNNMELGIEIIVDDCEIKEDGKVCVDAKTLMGIVSKLNGGEVTLKTDEVMMSIKCGRSKFNISIKESSEFPALDMVSRDNHITIDQEELKDAIRQTVFSTSTNDNNIILTGELFEVDGDKLKIVALDGHRVAIREIMLDGEYEATKLIIPAKTSNEIVKLLGEGDVDIFYTDTQVAFSFGNTFVTSRLIEGEFYDINKMMRVEPTTTVKVDRQELLSCMDRTMLLVRDIDRKPAMITIGDTLKVEMKSQLGSMDEEIEVEANGDTLKIGLNPRFMLDILKAIDDVMVTLSFSGNSAPCFVNGDGYSYCALPIRYQA